jgi:CheY-like chemotaxis protein
MPKVLLVEDDNNLREIFQMRLQAEGYTAVVAADGEEGLVSAMKEKPDLVIADVMMPKLSGFEMVESLRAAPETKDLKVIMMTALGQAEDQARGEKLGVLKYLVKSQVTLEDFARVVKEALGPGDPSAVAAAQNEASNKINQQESETRMQPEDQTNPTPAPADPAANPAPAEPSVNPVSGDAPADNSVSTDQQTTAQEENVVQNQINDFAGAPAAAPADDTTGAPAAPDATSTDAPAVPPATEPAPTPEAPAPETETPASPPDQTGNAL